MHSGTIWALLAKMSKFGYSKIALAVLNENSETTSVGSGMNFTFLVLVIGRQSAMEKIVAFCAKLQFSLESWGREICSSRRGGVLQ